MTYIGIDRRSIGNDKVETYYIYKISSASLLCLIAGKMLQYLYSGSEQWRYTC